MEKTIYQLLKEANCNIDSYCSDLYCFVDDTSRAIIEQYKKDYLAEYKINFGVKTFKSNIDGLLWYDIPLSFDPYWEKKGVIK